MSHAVYTTPTQFHSRGPLPVSRPEAALHYAILVHSHLSWDNVWQRPQQFLSRIAKNHPVLFVETHGVEEGEPRYEYGPAAGAGNVTQLKVYFPNRCWADGAWVDKMRRSLVKAAINEMPLRKFRQPVQWFYDPMTVISFAGHMNEILNVYDCMDQLSQFRGAPPEIVHREAKLLEVADLVFCGGKKLHEQKSLFHDNCKFYGCGVDTEHFARARSKEQPIPSDIADLPQPIYGYYGVIDERIDYPLLEALAQNTHGSVVMLGPLAKVHESDLPRHPDLHWLGRRSYEELPGYCKGFDVCMMPFALNEATEFINPTKALEYLGAGRPVVSTAVPDVCALFDDVVHIASDTAEFIRLCERSAAAPSKRIGIAGIDRAKANTWDEIVLKLQEHVADALQGAKRKKARLGRAVAAAR